MNAARAMLVGLLVGLIAFACERSPTAVAACPAWWSEAVYRAFLASLGRPQAHPAPGPDAAAALAAPQRAV